MSNMTITRTARHIAIAVALAAAVAPAAQAASEKPVVETDPGQARIWLYDAVAPTLTLQAQTANAAHGFRLTYAVLDNSGVSAETLIIKKGRRTVVATKTAFGAADGSIFLIRVKGLRKGTYRLQLTSRDKAGNASHVALARLRVK